MENIQMQEADIAEKRIKNQIDLYSGMCQLSVDMVQKLTKRNVEYFQTMLNKSLDMVNPITAKEPKLNENVQKYFTETIENNKKLYQDVYEIVSDTADRLMELEQSQHQVLDHSPINIFNLLSNAVPSATSVFKTFRDAAQQNMNKFTKVNK